MSTELFHTTRKFTRACQQTVSFENLIASFANFYYREIKKHHKRLTMRRGGGGFKVTKTVTSSRPGGVTTTTTRTVTTSSPGFVSTPSVVVRAPIIAPKVKVSTGVKVKVKTPVGRVKVKKTYVVRR